MPHAHRRVGGESVTVRGLGRSDPGWTNRTRPGVGPAIRLTREPTCKTLRAAAGRADEDRQVLFGLSPSPQVYAVILGPQDGPDYAKQLRPERSKRHAAYGSVRTTGWLTR